MSELTFNCRRCGKAYTRNSYDIGSNISKYCSRICQNRSISKLSAISTTQLARSRRPVVLEQPSDHRIIVAHAGSNSTPRVLVSIEDFDILDEHVWRISSSGYAVTESSPRRMHRRILERMLSRTLENNEYVDHINRNRLDNRRSNLRLATKSQNGFNANFKRNASGYVGVIRRQDVVTESYDVRIHHQGRVILIGHYHDVIEAAYVRDQFAIQLHGDFARLNVL